MDPVTMIVMALATGAAAALKPMAEVAIKDAYTAVKTLIRDRYKGINIDLLESDPASKSRQTVVKEDLSKTSAGQDAEVLRRAKVLLDAIQAHSPDAAVAVGIDLDNIKAASLKIQGVLAEGRDATGVKAMHLDVGSDITITDVQARGGSPVPKPLAPTERSQQPAVVSLTDVKARDVLVEATTITSDLAHDVTGLENPYLGLRPFTYDDRRSFAGRDEAIAEAITLLTAPGDRRTQLFITGASGSGKSSFAQAGLLPALETYYRERSYAPKKAVFRPGKRPLDMLADALLQLGLPRDALLDTQTAVGTPAAFSALVSSSTPEEQINLVVIDQFEEVFAQAAESQRASLIAMLSSREPFASLRTHFLITLRSDYLGELFNYRSLYDLAKQGLDLREMGEPALRASIESPLQAKASDPRFAPKTWERELVDELAHQAAPSATYLPLLQLTLQELWRRGHLTMGAYHDMGSILVSAIKDRATAVLEYTDYDRSHPTMPRSEIDREAIIRIFLDLIQVDPASGAGHPDIRRSRTLGELVGDADDPAAATRAHLVKDLVEARLLSAERRGEIDYIDVIHESLIVNWDRLQQAIASERQMLQQRARFEQALRDWQNNEGDLLTGIRLSEACALEERHDIALRNSAAREFLEQSKVRHEAELEERKVVEAQQLAETLRRQGDEVAALLPVKPLNALVRAIQAVGLNLDTSPDQLLPLVQVTLHAAVQGAKERKVLTGHSAPVRALTFSPKGDILVSAGDDRMLRVWNVRTGQQISLLEGHHDAVTALVFSPDGRILVSGSEDRTVRLWALDGTRVAVPLTGHRDAVTAVAFHPQSNTLASASDDGTVRLWDHAGNQLSCIRGHVGSVTSVAFSPDGQTLASTGIDRTVRLWDLRGRSLGRPFEGHNDFVAALAFHPTGNVIVSGGGDGVLRVWDLKGHELCAPLEGHDGFINAVAFTPDGDAVVSGGDDHTVRMWDLSGGQIGDPFHGHDHVVTSLSVGPNADLIASGSGDRTVRVWDWRTPFGGTRVSVPGREPGFAASLLPSRRIWVWDMYGDQIGPGWRGATDFVRAVALTHTGEIVSGGGDRTVRVWDFAGRELASMNGHTGTVTSLAASYDGRRVVSGSRDCTLRVWDITGHPIGEPFKGHEQDINAVAYSQDGKVIVSGSNDCTLRVWDITGHQIGEPFKGHKDYVSAVALSSQGHVASASGDCTLLLWDLDGHRIAGPFEGHEDYVSAVAFSPDGEILLSGGADGTVRLWDLQGKQIGSPLRGHEDRVESVVFSPDGRMILSAGRDGTLRLWDRIGNAIARPFRTRPTRKRGLLAAAFSHDGELAVSGGADGMLRVWRTASWRSLLTTACDRVRDHSAPIPLGGAEGAICQKYAWSSDSHS